MNHEEKHAAEVQRVESAIAALPVGAQQLVMRYRHIVERAGRLGTQGDSWRAYCQFIQDVTTAFAEAEGKVAGVKEQGTGV